MPGNRRAAVQDALDMLDQSISDLTPEPPVVEPEPEPEPAPVEMRDLMKGALDGMREAIALAKGSGASAAEGRRDHGENEDYDDEDDGQGDRPEEPGYEDMNMADEYVDVTRLLEDMGASHQTQLTGLRKLDGSVRRLAKALVEQGEQIQSLLKARENDQQLLLAQAGAIAAMSKGILRVDERLTAIPEPSSVPMQMSAGNVLALARHGAAPPQPAPGTRPTSRGGRRSLSDTALRKASSAEGGLLGGVKSRDEEKRLLAKAMSAGVIGDDEVTMWTNHGMFSPDAPTNAQILSTVEALRAG